MSETPTMPAAGPAPRIVALFDFDDTLVQGDTLWPFLVFTAGMNRCLTALIEALIVCGWRQWSRTAQDPGFRTALKTEILRRVLKGHKITALKNPIARLQSGLRWKETVRTELLRHHAEGHLIVIASGALDIYLHELLRDLPHHAVIATQMETEDGRLTGRMIGGNCVRRGKAAKVAKYLSEHGPFSDSWAYGNYPHDVPMLELARHRLIV